jgi:hypothetical protein
MKLILPQKNEPPDSPGRFTGQVAVGVDAVSGKGNGRTREWARHVAAAKKWLPLQRIELSSQISDVLTRALWVAFHQKLKQLDCDRCSRYGSPRGDKRVLH